MNHAFNQTILSKSFSTRVIPYRFRSLIGFDLKKLGWTCEWFSGCYFWSSEFQSWSIPLPRSHSKENKKNTKMYVVQHLLPTSTEIPQQMFLPSQIRLQQS